LKGKKTDTWKGFTEVFIKIYKNLTRHRFENSLDHQHNYIEISQAWWAMLRKVLTFWLFQNLIILMVQIKLFLDLYPIKFLDTSTKSHSPCIKIISKLKKKRY